VTRRSTAGGFTDDDIVTWFTAFRRPSAQRIVVPLLVLVAATMIILGKIDQVMFEPLRIAISDDAAPALEVLSRPLAAVESYVDQARGMIEIYQDNRRLTEENHRLRRWQQTALALASENARLRDLVKLAPQSAVSFVTARVIASSGGAFLRELMIDAGTADGIAPGQAAITGEGLVGRICEVGARSARILLISDLNSRVPVTVERSGQRAILTGDNSERPLLLYLDPAAPVTIGDRIVTSGTGGVFPPGLPVGIVGAVDRGAPRIEPFVGASQVDYVRIVDYGLADMLPRPTAAVAPATSVSSTGR
jgi:rod shape-determining protein MreC